MVDDGERGQRKMAELKAKFTFVMKSRECWSLFVISRSSSRKVRPKWS